jgi:GAF domain-containing protein/HAMP domain-containing protein
MSVQATSQQRPSAEVALPFWRQLRWSLILYFVLLAVVPVVAVIGINLYRSRDQIENQTIDQLESVTALKQEEITRWLDDSTATLGVVEAGLYNVFQFVNPVAMLDPDPDEVTEAELKPINDVLIYANDEHSGFNEFFVYITTDGRIVASSDQNQVGKIVTRQPYYEPSLASTPEDPYIQPPYYDIGSQELTMFVFRPIGDPPIAVLAGRLNLDALSDIMTARTGLGISGETYLVSAQTNYLLTESRFGGYERNRAYDSKGINAALAGESGSGIYSGYREPPVSVLGVYQPVPALNAALLAEQDESEALASYYDTRDYSLALMAVAAVLAAALGLFAATRISQPITALTQTATRIASGDLTERAEVRQRNEIGVLAGTFNDMTDQLRSLIGSLEDRVAARTQDLQIAAQVSSQAATLLDLDELLPQVVELTRSSFDLYHAHIYLLDDAGRNLNLAFGAGEAGRTMREHRHSIPLAAERSLVARAARDNTPVVIADTAQEPGFLPNPLLPETRSEAAFPLAVRGQVVGVLDVQSEQPGRFDADLQVVLSTLAGQIAITIANARLFTETDRARRHDQALSAITEQIQGALSMDEVLQAAARELGKALRVPHTVIELQLQQLAEETEGEQDEHYATDLEAAPK